MWRMKVPRIGRRGNAFRAAIVFWALPAGMFFPC